MNMILTQTSSFAQRSAQAPPQMELRPFDKVLWDQLETDEFAGRVSKEYRRFLYLAARARHPVTPSDTVDQAWHLHLIYTRHYWEELCGKILGLQLHHEPSAGGAVDSSKFERQYKQTIESYRAAFGETPPADIWPVCKPAKLGTRGKKLLVAGATGVGTAIALGAASIPLLIVVAIVGIIDYSHVATAAPNPGMRGSGCGAAGSGGHAAAAGNCGASGGTGGGADAGSGDGGGCGGGGCGGGGCGG